MNARLLVIALAACEHESVSRDPQVDRGSDHVVSETPPVAAPDAAVITVASDAMVDPDAAVAVVDALPAPKVAFFEEKNRKVLDAILDKQLNSTVLQQFNGVGTTKNDIDRAIKQQAGAVKACYTRALATKPQLAGKVTLKIEIAPSGSVTSATATGMDAAVGTCIANVIKKATFPAQATKSIVSYPFIFSSP